MDFLKLNQRQWQKIRQIVNINIKHEIEIEMHKYKCIPIKWNNKPTEMQKDVNISIKDNTDAGVLIHQK